jgi:hypothetical protein
VRGRIRILLILTALSVLVTKTIIAYYTCGTNDSVTFDADIAKLNSAGPKQLYREGVEPMPGHHQLFSHSPPVIHGLLLLKRLETESDLPVRFWLRLFCALADLTSLLLLWKIGVRSVAGLFFNALAPVSVMISGFHVNTDPLVTCAVLWSACLINSRRFAWAAGIALGIALSVKLTALIFIPALAIAAGVKRSAVMIGLAFACFYLLSLPFIWQFPKTIGISMFSYGGLYQFWGIPGILMLVGTNEAYSWYRIPGKFVALAVVGAAALIVRYRGRREDILTNCGLSAALFLLFTPGFGIQYLVYLVPWLAAARGIVAAGFYVVSGAFMIAFYTWGSGGFPWHSANFFLTRAMPSHVFSLGLLTWVAILFIAADFVRRAMVSQDFEDHRGAPPLQQLKRSARIRGDGCGQLSQFDG